MDAAGKMPLPQSVSLIAAGAVSGGFWGMRMGMICLSPLLGFAVGASAGAVSGSLADVGINVDFMKELAATLTPGRLALFVLVTKVTSEKVLLELQGLGGKNLQSSLLDGDEDKLQALLSAKLA